MLLVLKVVAGVLLALLLLVLLLLWWFRRWMRRIAGRAMDAAACMDPHQTRPARIQLMPAAADSWPGAALAPAWDTWRQLGLQALGDFEARPLDFPWVRAAAQAQPPLALALWAGDPEAADDPAAAAAAPSRFVLFALLERNRLLALSNEPGDTPLDTAGVRWIVEPDIQPVDALRRLARELQGQAAQAIDATLWRTVFERAWAARVDADIAQPPSRSAFDARLAARPEPVPPATADQAFELTLSHWRDQVREAALDQFRRASRIDAVRWETLRDDVHVVHEHLDDDTVIDWLADGEPERQLGAQLVQQGLHGTALYEGLDSRRPAAQRREKLGRVSRPLPATIYGPPAAAAVAAQAQPQAALRDHAYEAVDAQGATVRGAVMARDSADARRQLQAMGLDRARVMMDAVTVGAPEPYMLEPGFVAAKARAVTRGLAASLGLALLGNAWLWLPPLLWAGWSWWQGPPFGWGDWLSFVVAVAALGALAVLVLPMVLYHELQRARLFARWGRARACLIGLRRLNLLRAITPDQLLAEELKVQAGGGQLRQALARWAKREPHLPAHEYQLVRSTLHDAAGDHAGMIDAQRAWRDASPSKDMASVDLALSLARYRGPAAVEEAEALLAGVKADELSELTRGGYCYAQGVVLALRGQHAAASHQYQLAQRLLATFRNNPLMHGMLSEIGGYHALALRATGDAGAQALWDSVLPVLRAQPGPHPLLAAWAKGR